MKKILFLLIGLAIGIAVGIAVVPPYADWGCAVHSESSPAPGTGLLRAIKTEKQCDWGFGLSADSYTVRLEQAGAWFVDIPLEYDGAGSDNGIPPPALQWINAHALDITIYSNGIAGTLVTREANSGADIVVTRHYVMPPKDMGAAQHAE